MNNEIVEKVSKICALAMELSTNSHAQYVCDRDTLPVVFIYMSGHISQIDIQFYEKGWIPFADTTQEWELSYHEIEESPEILDKIIAEMERLAEIRYKMENPEV